MGKNQKRNSTTDRMVEHNNSRHPEWKGSTGVYVCRTERSTGERETSLDSATNWPELPNAGMVNTRAQGELAGMEQSWPDGRRLSTARWKRRPIWTAPHRTTDWLAASGTYLGTASGKREFHHTSYVRRLFGYWTWGFWKEEGDALVGKVSHVLTKKQVTISKVPVCKKKIWKAILLTPLSPLL